MSDLKSSDTKIPGTKATKAKWGVKSTDHYGYKSEAERKAKRGLEDWELVESIPQSQRSVPKWFLAVIVLVLMIALGLSFPFWGERPGFEREWTEWLNWGFALSILYLIGAGTFIYCMVNLYGPAKDSNETEEGSENIESSNEGDSQEKE